MQINCSLLFLVFKQVIRTEAVYWRADNPEHFSKENFPTFIACSKEGSDYYGLPIHEYPGLVKVHYCKHRDEIHFTTPSFRANIDLLSPWSSYTPRGP